jgi:enolase
VPSAGNPTVEVDLALSNGSVFRASVPSGASTGVHEAVERRDGGPRWMGKGVSKAVESVNTEIARLLAGADPCKQSELDRAMIELDGTPNKGRLGANAILGVSLAIAKAGAAASGKALYAHFASLAGVPESSMVLPVPALNVINGGEHAGNALAFQEFMILPTGAASFTEAMAAGCEVYHTLKGVVKSKYGKDAVNVGDEGGFAPPVRDAKECIEILLKAIDKAGWAGKVEIGLDCAASEFYTQDGRYNLDFKTEGSTSKILSKDALLAEYESMSKLYPIVSIEDPFEQDDWEYWAKLTERVGKKVQIVGDDLLCTNPTRVKRAIAGKNANALLLKVNQIGSVTESIEAVKMSQAAGWGVMTSHRSGETEDSYIADLAVGLATGQIKTGAPCRSERLAKYNQLLRIEESLGSDAKYAGKGFRHPLSAK